MSCRILGRNLESWILKELKKVAQKRGIEHVYAEYIETKSNSMCKSFYSDHNFKKIKATKKLQKKIKIKGALYYSKISNMDVKLSNVYD